MNVVALGAIQDTQWKLGYGFKSLVANGLSIRRLIEVYAQAFGRYIQCEEATSTYGLLGKHPTTGGVISSPFVDKSAVSENVNLSGMRFTIL